MTSERTVSTDERPRKLPPSPRITLASGVEIQLDRDGDLEIDISDATGAQNWEGVFLTNDEAKQLRDYLNKVLP